MAIDFDYLCRITAHLSGIPVRVYEGDNLASFHSPVALPRDPMVLYREPIWRISHHVGYYLTEDFYCYGVVTSGEIRFIVGPTRQLPASDQTLRELAFRMGLGKEEAEECRRSMKAIVQMPVESLLLMLCAVNYMVNGEKRELRDLTITTGQQEDLDSLRAAQAMERTDSQPPALPHNSYSQEQAILRIVRKGDTAALHTWLGSAPAIRGGILAPEHLRQMKNLFIVTATLCSRAAIRGGLDVDDAFSLSDAYIQVLEFTRRVERLHLGEHPGRLAQAVANYVQHHLSEAISTEALAQALYMGRAYLSTKFHAETGVKLNDFILQQKTEDAKRLLRYTDRTAAAIGEYLAFSSPAHFTRVFKKYAGVTPNEYREKHG